jgi:hypothetical protein
VGEVETLADAYQLAHDLEHSEINTVFAFLMRSYVSREDKRRFLDAVFAEHQDRLIEFADQVGGRGRMKAIAATRIA